MKNHCFALCMLFAWALGQAAQAPGLKSLEHFLSNTQSFSAEFVQVTESLRSATSGTKPTAPTGRAMALKGKFELQRPNQFRFHYLSPFEQVIQSDGQNLWIHEVDLNQVTQRRLSVAMVFAPALAVATVTDLRALSRLYDLQALPDAQGLQWVRASPRPNQINGEAGNDGLSGGGLGGAVKHVDLGLRTAAGLVSLGQLAIVDLNGHRTLMVFDAQRSNPGFAPKHFQFSAPAGASVLRP